MAQVARGSPPSPAFEQAIVTKLNHLTRVEKKDLTESLKLLKINPTEIDLVNLQDFHYYLYFPSSRDDFMELIRYLTMKRMNHVETVLTILENDSVKLREIKERIDYVVDVFKNPSNVTIDWHLLGNLLLLHCNSPNFDLGMSPELLSMLGWGKEERFTDLNLSKRQKYRHFLQMLVRLSEQVKTNPYSVTNYFVTGKNHLAASNRSFDYAINEALGIRDDSIFDANHIKQFKYLFMNSTSPLRLNLQNSTNYMMYMYFLKHVAKIERIDFAWPTSFHVLTTGKFAEFFDDEDLKEYLLFFYGEDPHIQKLLSKNENLFPILDIDLITFSLWKCALHMPLGEPISSTLPPKLNPHAQIWIYTNIIKDGIVNNSFKKLLAISTAVEHDAEYGRDCEITFTKPVYKPLNTNILDEIEILIATKFGNPVPFLDGPSTVQLVFKVDNF
jgi:hypothetical protein